MRFFKVKLPITLAFVMAVVAIASVFIPHHYSDNFRTENTVWFRVIGGVTMFIGAYSLLRVHYGRIKRQQKGWGYSMVLFVFFATVVLFGILNYGNKKFADAEALVLSDDQAQAMDESLARDAATQPDKAETLVALTGKDGKPLTGPKGYRAFVRVPARAKGIRELKDALGNPVTLKLLQPKTATTQPTTVADTAPSSGPTTATQQAARNGNSRGQGSDKKPLYVNVETGVVTDVPVTGVLGPFQPRSTLKEGGRWMYEAIQWPAGSTQYALLGFFICSAAYRTFRAKTIEAAVLLIAALVVMLGQVPIARMIWEKIPMASGWLLDVPNMAVKRAIMFGICVGSVGTSLRVMFGVERSYMGGD